MEIFKKQAYNHKVGRYKTLSSNAGVGSIVTTSTRYFVMPLSVTKWGFVDQLNTQICNLLKNCSKEQVKDIIATRIDIIEDPRFIEFLKKEQNLTNLDFIVEVPYLGLDECNYPKPKKHPLNVRFTTTGNPNLGADYFTIPAIHFPRWFYSSRDGRFMCIEKWINEWRRKGLNDAYFAPPRDPGDDTKREFTDGGQKQPIYRQLNQVPLLLICDKGHISDIPWYKYFCAKIEKRVDLKSKEGIDLFSYDCSPCTGGGEHDLIWLENRNNAESWGFIKCKKCGESCNLEGIMNIRPFCPSHTPWNGANTYERGVCTTAMGQRNKMRVVMATSNSVYYADSFRGLYIPVEYLESQIILTEDSRRLLKIIEGLYDKWRSKPDNSSKSLVEYIAEKDDGFFMQKARDNRLQVCNSNINEIRSFVNSDIDSYENYRFAEYKVLTENNNSNRNVGGLEFRDIDLTKIDDSLKPYFCKIQQVETLSITQAQLGFLRGSMPIPRIENGQIIRDSGQKIYNCADDEVRLLPAYRSYGEGIFIEFNRAKIEEWVATNKDTFTRRYENLRTDIGTDILEDVSRYGRAAFYLLHTFSHILIKELEFACGYPSASLQERLYYSDRMCGVLIYTTDGAEGSMGGLVWQGQPDLISRTIISAINRAKNCSSDPLCSIEEDQINLAACFSCCIISETSCEKRNLCLDRLSLIGDFGYFKDV